MTAIAIAALLSAFFAGCQVGRIRERNRLANIRDRDNRLRRFSPSSVSRN